MIIGIAGRMGSGKDTVAEFLSDEYNAYIHHFSDKLKEIAFELFDVKKKDVRGRRILQQLGMKMREIDPNVWINYLLNDIKEAGWSHVIADVRFRNEAKAILEAGGYVICLDVLDNIRLTRVNARDGPLTTKQWKKMNMDPSETEVDKIYSTFESGYENVVLVSITKNYSIPQVNKFVKHFLELKL